MVNQNRKGSLQVADWSSWQRRSNRITSQYRTHGLTDTVISDFQRLITAYGHEYGRHDLPWRQTQDPYCVLVSEFMLQQTQVARVQAKYPEFIRAFPDWSSLARAPLSRVLRIWQGLGYNKRALYLKRTAQVIVQQYQGDLPGSVDDLCSLPGIGPATAGALCAFVFNMPVVFIETNIRTVFLYVLMPNTVNVADITLLSLIDITLTRSSPRQWYQALMDFGVFIKRNVNNPNQLSAGYKKHSPFQGSDREIRGKIIRYLIKKHEISKEKLGKVFGCSRQRIDRIVRQLVKEHLVEQDRSHIRINQHP